MFCSRKQFDKDFLRLADLNHDGMITPEEVFETILLLEKEMDLPELSLGDKAELKKIIKKSDLDGDGKMTKLEMKPILDFYFNYLQNEFENDN